MPLSTHETWPSFDAYTALAERERQRRAPWLAPVRFAPAAPKRARFRRTTPVDVSTLYEGRIGLLGEVPCLPASYHDLFNALAWAAFPRAKRALHTRQLAAIQKWIPEAALRLPNRRTREQDALTLLDEGGAVWLTDQPLPTSESVARRRAPLNGYSFIAIPFGHALMDHLAWGSGEIRAAGVWIAAAAAHLDPAALLDLVDETLARRLSDPSMFTDGRFDGALCFSPSGEVRLEV